MGAQTAIIARNNPGTFITSIDLSVDSLAQARERMSDEGIRNVTFQRADIFDLPFEPESFDHVLVCFVLEHLPQPLKALLCLKAVLKPRGTITVIEGDHGSACFYPESPHARRAIQCLIDLQARSGGNSLIGRQLYPLLTASGFKEVRVSPRMVYADASRPEMVEGFTKKTFAAMVEGVGEQAIVLGMIGRDEWRKGIEALDRTAEKDGTFCYTFFKATGVNRPGRS